MARIHQLREEVAQLKAANAELRGEDDDVSEVDDDEVLTSPEDDPAAAMDLAMAFICRARLQRAVS